MLGLLCIFGLPLVIGASFNAECYVDTDCADNFYCDPVLSLCYSCEGLCSHPKQKPYCDIRCPDYNKETSIGSNLPTTITIHTEGTFIKPQAIKSGQNLGGAHGSPVLVSALVSVGLFLGVACIVVIVVWKRGNCTFRKTHRPIMQETAADGGPSIYKPFNHRIDVVRNPKQEQNSLRGSREELAANTASRPEAITMATRTSQASRLAGHADSPLFVHASRPAGVRIMQQTAHNQTMGTSQGHGDDSAADQLLPDPSEQTEGHPV